jgi:hypothetical protein
LTQTTTTCLHVRKNIEKKDRAGTGILPAWEKKKKRFELSELVVELVVVVVLVVLVVFVVVVLDL